MDSLLVRNESFLNSLVVCQPGPQVVLQPGGTQCEGVVVVLALTVHAYVPQQNRDNVHYVTLSGGKTYSDPFSF